MKYSVVGSLSGVSKKNNEPYTFLHCVCTEQPRNANFHGLEVEKFYINRNQVSLSVIPEPDDIVDITFNRSGYVDRVEIV